MSFCTIYFLEIRVFLLWQKFVICFLLPLVLLLLFVVIFWGFFSSFLVGGGGGGGRKPAGT